MNQQAILYKLGISALNPMQLEAGRVIPNHPETILLSPTGTGKTLAYLLPLLLKLDRDMHEVQLLIVVPSRELAMQTEQVVRSMGAGYKVNAIYGGRAGSQDKIDLKHRPAILIGTPGRIADHLRKQTFTTDQIKTLVLDEFDKSLEIGFEAEMSEIISTLKSIKTKVLTSATKPASIPAFAGLHKPRYIDYLHEKIEQLSVKMIISPSKDKIETLVDALSHLGNQPGIIFCNFKDSIQYVSEKLTAARINHGCFHGGMEQIDRERTLLKFRNGTHQLIVATDLAARGLDIPEIKFIIHYQLPAKEQEFIHRNGRTARMNNDGTAYILATQNEKLPEFIGKMPVEKLRTAPLPAPSPWSTVYVTGGRRDKISKSDIAGFFMKQGKLQASELGIIEIKAEGSFVAVPTKKVAHLIKLTNNMRLKTKKVRVSECE